MSDNFRNKLELKLQNWSDKVDNCNLAVPGLDNEIFINSDLINFPTSLSSAERKIVHQIASLYKLHHYSSGSGSSRRIVVSRYLNDLEISHSNDVMEKPKINHYSLSNDESEKNATHLNITIDSSHGFIRRYIFESLGRIDDQFNPSHSIPSNGIFVNTIKQLKDMVTDIKTNFSEFSFDLELHSVHSYYGHTCLLQISTFNAITKQNYSSSTMTSSITSSIISNTNTYIDKDNSSIPGKDYIIDVITLWDHIHHELYDLFADPSIIKIGHALKNDILALHRDFGIVVTPLFDVQHSMLILQNHQLSCSKVDNNLTEKSIPGDMKLLQANNECNDEDAKLLHPLSLPDLLVAVGIGKYATEISTNSCDDLSGIQSSDLNDNANAESRESMVPQLYGNFIDEMKCSKKHLSQADWRIR